MSLRYKAIGRVLAETWVAADAMVMTDLDFTLTNMSTGQRWLRGDELTPIEARFSQKNTRTV